MLGALRLPGMAGTFARSFFAVLVVTAVASLVAEGALFYLIAQRGQEIPNTSKQVVAIESYAEENAPELLSGRATARSELATRVRNTSGAGYALLDARGRPLEATSGLERAVPVARLTGLISDTEANGDRFREVVPLIRDGEVGGYLLLEYPRGNAAIGTAQRLGLLTLLSLTALLPAIFLAISTVFFARRLDRRFGEPIGELRGAVESIRDRDLTFSIDYDGRDELGELCRAFEELRDELKESLEREWRGRQDLEDTVAALSHDLRTPATVIRGHVEALSQVRDARKRTERLERYLPVIEAASQRMASLLDDMLLVASLERGTTRTQPRSADLPEELSRKAGVYRLRAAERGVHFSLHAPERSSADDSKTATLDADSFERVLDNLFENALRFTPKGGNIVLEGAREADELTVAMRDSGPGAAPEDLPRVFEKFYRGEKQPPTSKRSSGLGLYISRLLVEGAGGHISLVNLPKGGCKAKFVLPLRESSANPSPMNFPSRSAKRA